MDAAGLEQSPQLEEVGLMFLSRRQFLKVTAGTVAAVAVADNVLALTALQPVIEVGNPLGDYPDRSWERVYHDQYRYDSSFTWVCSPNDTHACRVRAFVRNGVVTVSYTHLRAHETPEHL